MHNTSESVNFSCLTKSQFFFGVHVWIIVLYSDYICLYIKELVFLFILAVGGSFQRILRVMNNKMLMNSLCRFLIGSMKKKGKQKTQIKVFLMQSLNTNKKNENLFGFLEHFVLKQIMETAIV